MLLVCNSSFCYINLDYQKIIFLIWHHLLLNIVDPYIHKTTLTDDGCERNTKQCFSYTMYKFDTRTTSGEYRYVISRGTARMKPIYSIHICSTFTFHEKKVKVLVYNSTKINKTNNHLSTEIIEHNKSTIYEDRNPTLGLEHSQNMVGLSLIMR